MVKNWVDTKIRVSPILFHQLSAIEEPEGGQNGCLASAACTALWFLVPYLHCCLFFLSFCAVCGAASLPIVYAIQDISETSFFVTPIGFLSTRNR